MNLEMFSIRESLVVVEITYCTIRFQIGDHIQSLGEGQFEDFYLFAEFTLDWREKTSTTK